MDDRAHRVDPMDLENQVDARTRPRSVPIVHDRGFYESAIKPGIDRVTGFALSVVTLPFMAIVVPVIWSNLGRPAIFRQQRIGRFGEEFTVYKLRTMESDRRSDVQPISHDERRITHKTESDPRHTPLGRFLRKWSLDEIPQFWNVALGDMSLVGPRPELGEVVDRYEEWQHRRHEVRPGLTGLWQVSARADGPMHEATDIDIDYVDNVGFGKDLKIVLSTPQAILGSQKGH